MNYTSLPLITFDASSDINFLLATYAPFASDFMIEEISKMLQSDYDMRGTISILPNIAASAHAITRLLYLQAFMIFDAVDGYYTKRKDLDSYELRYTLEGEGTLEYEGKKYILRAGDGFFISSKRPHTYYASSCGWKCSVLHINGSLCQDYFSVFGADGNYKFSKESIPSFETMQYQVIKATQRLSPYQEYRIHCLLDLLLCELVTYEPDTSIKEKDSNAAVITALLDHIHSHFSEEIIFENIAKDLGVSRTLLFRDFKRYTGSTPAQYLTNTRIRQAQLLLKGSDMSIEQIAYAVGYNDAAHFSQVFKKALGITPLKYRKR